ncbi:MAG: Stf0 family sulfotransferase [Chloroflexota bacterium]
MVAEINYAILSSHRSGSTLLCNLLSQTGVAGKPGEYFSHWRGRSLDNFTLTDYPAYIDYVVESSRTPNSVFGMKMMAGDDGFSGILQRLETVPDYKALSDPEKIRTFFPNIKFIYLTRRNKVAQAVSWWKAAQSDHYHTSVGEDTPDFEMKYDADAITHLFQEAVMEECAHQAFLTKMNAIPLTIVYEDYIQDMPATIARIIDFLGIEDDYTFHPPQIKQMADDITAEWIERYRKELQANWQNIRW